VNLSNRQQLLGLVAIGVVALLVGDRLIFSPLGRNWKERATRIAELKRSVTQGTQLLGRENGLRSHWEHMRTNTLSGEVSVAENEVLKAFDRWSQDSRIGITSIKPQWKRNSDQYMTLECRVDAFGNLSAITRFLYEIDKDPLAFKVESVEITSRDDTGGQLGLGLQVSSLLLNPKETQ
jgi:hypothetical protein